MAIQEGFAHIAKLRLNGRTMHVLMYMMSKLDFENYIRLPQKQIAESLDIKRPDVSKATKELVEFGILHKGPKMGNSWTYRLDPNFGWKGKASKKKAAEEAIRKAKERGWDVI